VRKVLRKAKRFLKASTPILLLAISLGYILYTRLTGSTLLETPSIDEMKVYGPLLLPLIYVATYIARAWAPLLFAYILAGFINEFIPRHVLVERFSSTRLSSYLLAALFAPLLAVCSCVMIPVFAGLVYSGAGIGPATAFLFAAPAANLIAITLTADLVSWRIAIARFVAALAIATLVGYAVARTPWAQRLEKRFGSRATQRAKVVEVKRSLCTRLWQSFLFSCYLAKTILPYMLLGIAIASYVHAYVPPTLVSTYLRGFLGIVLGALIGVPMYTPTCVEVFLVNALKHLGMAPSAALAFLIGAPITSIPAILGISRVVGWGIAVLYIVLAIVGAIAAGILYHIAVGSVW